MSESRLNVVEWGDVWGVCWSVLDGGVSVFVSCGGGVWIEFLVAVW